MDLLTNRINPGVDEAAYVKAAFLTAVARGEAKSPLVSAEKATELLATMQGGYNIATLVELLDHPTLANKAADGLTNTILMFEAFHDVEQKAKAGNKAAQLEIAMIKVQAPLMALSILDNAIQAHGGGGVSQDFKLAHDWAALRTLRFADGPDEVHNRAIARSEFGKRVNPLHEALALVVDQDRSVTANGF